MPDRMVRESFRTSASLNRCSLLAYLTWPLLAILADAHGRFEADARAVLIGLFPYRDDVTEEMVDGWLQEYVREGMLKLWRIDERRYGQIVNFTKHQRMRYTSRRSRFPHPEDAVDQAEGDKPTQEHRIPREVLDAIHSRWPGGAPSNLLQGIVRALYRASSACTAADVVEAIEKSHHATTPVPYVLAILSKKKEPAVAAPSRAKTPAPLPTEWESLNG